MQEIQYTRELSDQELENVLGGAGTSHSALATANASALATGGFFHINEGFAQTEAFTVVNRKGISASFALGIAFAVAL